MSSYLDKMFGLQDTVSVVIGGTGVLGGAFCRGLAQAGATVIVAGRSEERGLERVKELEELGGKAKFIQVDISSRESIKALLDQTVEEFGQVDSLINGAGVNFASSYLDIEDDSWDHVIDSNLKAVHHGCQIFGKYFIDAKRPGAIINIASVTSHKPLSRVFAYSASKAAVVNLTENVAREFAPHNIRVNALCPGFFPAEQNRKILDKDRVATIMSQTPMNRFGEPDELIGAVLLMMSPVAGSFITGEAIYVDGGFTGMRF